MKREIIVNVYLYTHRKRSFSHTHTCTHSVKNAKCNQGNWIWNFVVVDFDSVGI